MTTLTETSFFSRKFFIWAIIAVVAIVLLWILIMFGNNLRKSLFPSGPLPASVAFGKLARLDLSEGARPSGGITYSIETVTGDLPNDLPRQAKVFGVLQIETSFGDPERAKTIARSLFVGREPEIFGSTLRFTSQIPGEILVMDSTSGNFVYQTDYFTTFDALKIKSNTSLDNAKAVSRTFFGKFGLSERDFPTTKIVAKPYKINGRNLIVVDTASQGNLVEVSFIRDDLDGIPVVYAVATDNLVRALVLESAVVEGRMNILKVQKQKFATYPLKGVVKAFEDLKVGNAAFNKPLSSNQFPIRSVTLAYLESIKNTDYLQPVYVFKSDNDLAAYVQAVDVAWTQ